MLHSTIPWVIHLILHCNPAFLLAKTIPASFSRTAETSAEYSVYGRPSFGFKIANIMMKMQWDKMALIILILDVFASSNLQMDSVFSRKSAGVIMLSFRCIVKKLLAKQFDAVVNSTLLHIGRLFSDDTFKLDTRK